jgi:thymidylate synthase
MKYTHEDGTPYSKEEFLQKLKTDREFNDEFGNKGIDQIANLINELKTNPDSRRLMVNAWNVGELDEMVLLPCHYGFQVYTRELSFEERYVILKSRTNEDPLKYSRLDNGDYDQHPKEMTTKWMNEENIPTRAISLMWNQRSVDTFLGLPFNIASYGLLLEIIAKEVNMVPDHLIGNLGDVHLYNNHIEQAKEQIGREPFELPTLRIASGPLDDIAHHEIMDFDILNYESHPAIKAQLSN